MEGLAARKSQRQIARELYGVESAAAEGWDPDGDVRARVRRLVGKARFLMRAGTSSSRPGGGRGCEFRAGARAVGGGTLHLLCRERVVTSSENRRQRWKGSAFRR